MLGSGLSPDSACGFLGLRFFFYFWCALFHLEGLGSGVQGLGFRAEEGLGFLSSGVGGHLPIWVI